VPGGNKVLSETINRYLHEKYPDKRAPFGAWKDAAKRFGVGTQRVDYIAVKGGFSCYTAKDELLRLFEEGGTWTKKDAAREIGYSERHAGVYVNALVQEGKLTQVGWASSGGRPGHAIGLFKLAERDRNG
jgi:hypothetical protein